MKYTKDDIIILDDNEIKLYQNELLRIIKDIVPFFEKHGIDYSLSGGSILGAVRHKGFIPWDDDIDINIPRKSYNKLLEIFDIELGESYYLQTPKSNPELGLLVTQIRKKGTVARRKYDWNSPKEQCGISIDLYIVENTFNNGALRFIQKYSSLMLNFGVSAVRNFNNRNLPEKIKVLEEREVKYSNMKLLFGRVLKIIPLKKWLSWNDKCNSCCKDWNSKYVAIPTGRKHFPKEIYKREDMSVYKKGVFEGEKLNIPIFSEEYLKIFYGEDYMNIPPKGKREKHLFLELKY